MSNQRCNPYLDTRLTFGRIMWMTVSTIVFIGGVIYGIIRGMLWRIQRKERDERLWLFHNAMHKFFQFDLLFHPWLHCDIRNPYGETFENGAIAICNHQSLLDPLGLLILSPKLLMVTGERVWKNPIVNPIFHLAEFACVRHNIDELREYCRYHISKGYTVVIFPEGERSADGRILRFHSGAFEIARELNVDILPLYLHGSGYVLPLHRAFQNRAKMYIEIGQRIPCNDPLRAVGIRRQATVFRQHYGIYYDKICHERETASYFNYLVTNLWGLVDNSSYATNLLKRYDNFAQWIDYSYDKQSGLWIEDYTNGVFTLVFVLVHQDISICASGCKVLKRLYATCAHLPANLTFTEDTGRGRILFSVPQIANVLTDKNNETV